MGGGRVWPGTMTEGLILVVSVPQTDFPRPSLFGIGAKFPMRKKGRRGAALARIRGSDSLG
jgi:hypothetical protein